MKNMKVKTVTITLMPDIIKKIKIQSEKKLGKINISGWITYLVTNYQNKLKKGKQL